MANEKTHILIVGGGIFGLACAYKLARNGLRVSVYDAADFTKGASRGVLGALLPHAPEQWSAKKQFQYESLRDGESFWTEVDKLSGGNSGYGRIGRITPIGTERALIQAQARAESARKHWGPQFTYRIKPAPDVLGSGLAPFGVVHETLGARLYPLGAMNSLHLACETLGVALFANHPVTALGPQQIYGPWGQASGDYIIIAGGVGGFTLLDQYYDAPTGRGVKGQAALLGGVDGAGLPIILMDGFYLLPHQNGQIAIGSTSENIWHTPTDTDEKLDQLIDRAKDTLPMLRDAYVVQRWANLRPRARAPDPMLGPLPHSQIYVALGGYKTGFGFAPKIASSLCDMILGKGCELPRSFAADFQLDGVAPQFLRTGADQ